MSDLFIALQTSWKLIDEDVRLTGSLTIYNLSGSELQASPTGKKSGSVTQIIRGSLSENDGKEFLMTQKIKRQYQKKVKTSRLGKNCMAFSVIPLHHKNIESLFAIHSTSIYAELPWKEFGL